MSTGAKHPSLISRPAASSIVIRPLAAADLPQLEWDGVYTHQRPVFERTFAEVARGTRLMLVAVSGENVIGQVFVQLRSSEPEFAEASKRGYLYSLRVRPEWRGHGIGSQLVAAAEAELVARGYHEAAISTAKDNVGARRLYERLGYRVFKEDPGEWWFTDVNGVLQHVEEPCWVMEKALNRKT
jgi:ribosomal protein S18 acetylase RimI-like enzyme